MIRTEPAIGAENPSGAAITIFVSTGGNRIAVPQLEGQTESEAKSQLANAGLTPEIKYQDVPANDSNNGKVISQGTNAGTLVDPGSVLRLTVGRAISVNP